MTWINTDTLTAMRAVANETMTDACQIGTPTASTGPEPMPASWTYGSSISCAVSGSDVSIAAEGAQVAAGMATIRLPLSATVAANQRVKVVERWGNTVSEVYEIVGEPMHAVTSLLLTCQRVPGDIT